MRQLESHKSIIKAENKRHFILKGISHAVICIVCVGGGGEGLGGQQFIHLNKDFEDILLFSKCKTNILRISLL